jgi:hypothetical protein
MPLTHTVSCEAMLYQVGNFVFFPYQQQQQQQQQQQLSLLSQASRGRLDMKPKGTTNIKTRRRSHGIHQKNFIFLFSLALGALVVRIDRSLKYGMLQTSSSA